MSPEVPLRDFAALRKRMEERRGEPVPFDESMWTLCNERAVNLIEGRDYLELRSLYLHMAEYLSSEGKDSFCVLEEASRAQLLHLARQDPSIVVEIVCGDDACLPCREQKGMKLPAGEALVTMPLPHKGCRYRPGRVKAASFCRCEYRGGDR